MSENQIRVLLKKYLEGSATPEEKKIVDDWYHSISQRDEAPLSEVERMELRKFYWESLRKNMDRTHPGRHRILPRILAVAATISAIVILSVVYFKRDNTLPEGPMQLAVHTDHFVNRGDSAMQLRLLDGSVVWLSPGSVLDCGEGFNREQRKVYLTGHAFFDIERDEQKPFYVFAGDVVTKVLGTSFEVKAYPEEPQITVSVVTGKVSVFTKLSEEADPANVILTPNQEAVYSMRDRKVARTLVSDPRIIIPDEEVKKIRFEGAPISDIFRALEKMYGVDIVYDEQKFSDCTITTSVDGKDLYERIDVICDITGARYSIEETRIVIHGTGC